MEVSMSFPSMGGSFSLGPFFVRSAGAQKQTTNYAARPFPACVRAYTCSPDKNLVVVSPFFRQKTKIWHRAFCWQKRERDCLS